jgi:hypothetical protein
MTDDDLPPLPCPAMMFVGAPDGYTEQQMCDYARAAIRHWIAWQKPVAYGIYWQSGGLSALTTRPPQYLYDCGDDPQHLVPLYRLDGGGTGSSED